MSTYEEALERSEERRNAIRREQEEIARLERLGGPGRLEKARRGREHVYCWLIEEANFWKAQPEGGA